jgi:hypothetical protein
MSQNKLTKEYLEEVFMDNASVAAEYCKSLYPEYPKKPTKPTLNRTHTKKELSDYQKAFDTYLKDEVKYKELRDFYRDESDAVDQVMIAYMKDISGFNAHVPDDKKDKVWNKAWSDGHSSGYGEVYNYLVDLVDLFT